MSFRHRHHGHGSHWGAIIALSALAGFIGFAAKSPRTAGKLLGQGFLWCAVIVCALWIFVLKFFSDYMIQPQADHQSWIAAGIAGVSLLLIIVTGGDKMPPKNKH